MSDSDRLYEFPRENGIFPPGFLPSEPPLPTEEFSEFRARPGIVFFPLFFPGGIVGVLGFGVGLNQVNLKEFLVPFTGVLIRGSARILWKILVGKKAHSNPKFGNSKGRIPWECGWEKPLIATLIPTQNPASVSGESLRNLAGENPEFPPKFLSQPAENPSGTPWGKPQNPAPKSRECLGNLPGMPGWEMKWDEPREILGKENSKIFCAMGITYRDGK